MHIINMVNWNIYNERETQSKPAMTKEIDYIYVNMTQKHSQETLKLILIDIN